MLSLAKLTALHLWLWTAHLTAQTQTPQPQLDPSRWHVVTTLLNHAAATTAVDGLVFQDGKLFSTTRLGRGFAPAAYTLNWEQDSWHLTAEQTSDQHQEKVQWSI